MKAGRYILGIHLHTGSDFYVSTFKTMYLIAHHNYNNSAFCINLSLNVYQRSGHGKAFLHKAPKFHFLVLKWEGTYQLQTAAYS